MKAVCWNRVALLVLGFAFAGAQALNAQEQPQTGQAPAGTPTLYYLSRGVPAQFLEMPANQTTIRTKHFELGGPLARPFKERGLGRRLKRLAGLFNPFAPAEPSARITRVGGLSSRPWAATVGWSPGQSAFPDERTDVPTLTLFSGAAR